MKIALGQINPTVGDFSGNAKKIVEFARRAQASGAQMVIFPELAVCGYPPRDLVEKPAFVGRSQRVTQEIAAAVPDIAIVTGFVSPAAVETGKSVSNSAAVLHRGEIQFVQSKMLLPTYDVFDELRYFAPASKQQVFPFGEKQMAVTICEDAWNDKHFWPRRLYSIDPVEELLHAGANMVLNIAASPFHLGKRELRRKMLATIARDNKVPVVMVNQVGGNDQLVFDGSSVVIAPNGKVIAQAKSFEEDLVLFDTETLHGDVHPEIEGEEASAYAALVLGTRDYVRKCGFERVMIGLSGGIDS
ncbi:MAG TPA: nitrilase-related carbon-nitrogen hydrolase, partial [Candidatus Angelobacter sp.]|nr:nitrilase-related carbon-nitrogen hydrolase [Candidatus Angelobacter sp.]